MAKKIFILINISAILFNFGLTELIRSKKLDLNVETLICTDYSIFKMHENILSSKKWSSIGPEVTNEIVRNHIKSYYSEIINQVNQRYEASFSDDPRLSIKITISQFYIAESPEMAFWFDTNKYINSLNETKVNGDLTLIDFNSWLELNRFNFSSFDHAFGVTAMDITSSDENLDYNGLAYIYGICKKSYSGSLVEDRGAFESVRSFAHELAHSLGTDHDGYSDSLECSEWDNYIMSAKFLPYNQENSWILSNCSKNGIKEFLSDYNHHFCLLNKPLSNEFSQGSNFKIFPGQIYNLFDQCKHLHGSNSTPCFEYESSFCQNLYCHKNGTNSECVWVAPATEGSDCGNGGWCIKGRCVKKTNDFDSSPKEKPRVLFKKENELIEINEGYDEDLCEDLMDEEFCETVIINDYCGDKFYWNGKNIGKEWCKKKCNKC